MAAKVGVAVSTRETAEGLAGTQAPRLMRLLRVAHEVEVRLESVLADLNLSMGKFMLLATLAESKGPLALSQLAEDCGCVRSNVTQLVDRLEADGLVARVDNPSDRRSIRASLTPLGRDRFRHAARIVERAERDLVSDWQDADRAAFARVLHLLGPNAHDHRSRGNGR